MKVAELIQILMRDENIDKEIVIIDADTDDEHEVEDARDVGHAVKLVIDLNETLGLQDCVCECDLCRHCLDQ